MRVVVDTHILVSAPVFPAGRGEAALQRIIAEQDDLALSKPILDELLGIPRSQVLPGRGRARAVAVFLSTLATFVGPRRRLQVVEDEPDNRVLECALTGRAQAIVTGDRALLALHDFRGMRLLSLRD